MKYSTVIPDSPYDELGYTSDSKFEYVGGEGYFRQNEVIWLDRDDNTSSPKFTCGRGGYYIDLEGVKLIKEDMDEPDVNLATVFTPLQEGDSFKIKADWDDDIQGNWYRAGELYIVKGYIPKENSYNVVGLPYTAWVKEDAIDFDSVVKASVASPTTQEDGLNVKPSVSIGNEEKVVVEATGSYKLVEISSQHTLTIKGKVVGVFSTEELLLIQQEIMNYV